MHLTITFLYLVFCIIGQTNFDFFNNLNLNMENLFKCLTFNYLNIGFSFLCFGQWSLIG